MSYDWQLNESSTDRKNCIYLQTFTLKAMIFRINSTAKTPVKTMFK